MPRSEGHAPPGPFTDAARVARVDFRFDVDGRRQLFELLERASPELSRPCAPPVLENAAALTAAGLPVPKTPAGWIVAMAEEQIRLLRSAQNADTKAAPGNPANYRAAIRRLRQRLKPFVLGWVDPKTAEIANWQSIDGALAEREAQLAGRKRSAPYSYRELQHNSHLIIRGTRELARIYGVSIDDDVLLRFIVNVLDLAEIEHPDPAEHPGRLRTMVGLPT
jgi:hypothetical protein